MPLAKLPFALKDNMLTVIDMVPSGLACNCNCPGCGEPLVAKKGTKMIHHFSHKSGKNCSSSLETALHLKAKEIFEHSSQFMLPAVYLPNKEAPLFKPQLITYSKVITEKKSGNIIPDLLLKIKNKWLIIEIAVQHFTGKEKIKSIREMGRAAIEIDANALLNRIQKGQQFFQSHRFANYLLRSSKYKTWLFNPRQQMLEDELRQSAIRKNIRTLHFTDKNYYITENCPKAINIHRSGYRMGKSYANVFRDCLNCEHCIEIEYEKYFFGSKEVNGKPRSVWCSQIPF